MKFYTGFNCAYQFDISGDVSSEWLYIGTLLVDGLCSNHLSGPAADDGELINSRAVFISALIMSKTFSIISDTPQVALYMWL